MSLSFRRPRLEDRQEVKKILEKSGNIDSASAFGTLYLWAEGYDINICVHDGVLLKKSGKSYGFPRGAESDAKLKACLEALKQNCLNSEKFILDDLLENDVRELDRILPGKFSFSKNRDNAEYIYDIKNLAQLSGKKYHGKRNHISAFSKQYDWRYAALTAGNVNDIRQCANEWYAENEARADKYLLCEKRGVEIMLQNAAALKIRGGIIYIGEKAVAFTLGSAVNRDVFDIHIEKSLAEYAEGYTVINREFAANELANYKYINREDDMGLDGLRQAKLSYHPAVMVKKYSAVKKVTE